jgi:hypothetical protein
MKPFLLIFFISCDFTQLQQKNELLSIKYSDLTYLHIHIVKTNTKYFPKVMGKGGKVIIKYG